MTCIITIFIRKKIKGQKRLGNILDAPIIDQEYSCSVPMAISQAAAVIEHAYNTKLPAFQIKKAQGSNYYKRFFRVNFNAEQIRDIRRNCQQTVKANLTQNDFAGTVIINVID